MNHLISNGYQTDYLVQVDAKNCKEKDEKVRGDG